MKKIYLTLIFLIFTILAGFSQSLAGKKIYVNPGHGGYDSDDRNIVIYPFAQGDPAGFWESKSNLHIGLQLFDMLEGAGATTYISRTQNRTEDDLPLSQIITAANLVNADFMLSIHSNAGANGTVNYVLQLYSGVDPGDTHVYPSPTPHSPTSRAICEVIGTNQMANGAAVWNNKLQLRGDKSFARLVMGWSDGYGVLRGLNVPGCISEGSFHEYRPQAYRLMNMDYKWLEAWQFFKSFCSYFGAGEQPTGNIAGTVHDSKLKNEMSYFKLPNTRDDQLPLHSVKVKVTSIADATKEYSTLTDDLYNGFYLLKNLEPGSYEIICEKDKYTPDTQTVVVKANETTYLNFQLNRVRDTPPEVVAYSPNVSLTETQKCMIPISMEFNWDIDTESAVEAFSITPDIAGDFSFENSNFRMVFTPKVPYEISTVYTVKLDTKLKHPADLHLENDFTFQFKTDNRNRLKLLSSYPKSGDEGVSFDKNLFEFRFDKKLLNTNVARDGIKVFDSSGNECEKFVRSFKVNGVKNPYGSFSFSLIKKLVEGEQYKIVLNEVLIDTDEIGVVEPIEYFFKVKNIKVTDKPIVQDFEQANVFSFEKTKSSKVKSASYNRDNKTKLFKSYTGRFNYEFENETGGVVFYAIKDPIVLPAGDQVMGVHIYGDLTENEIELEFTATDNSVSYLSLVKLDFLGWEYAEIGLSTLPSDKVFRFTGIKIIQKENIFSEKGAVYMDNLLLTGATGTKLYENKSLSLVLVQNAQEISVFPIMTKPTTMELFSISGNLIKTVKKSVMGLEDVRTGIYLLRVKADGKQLIRTIIVP